MNVFANQSSCQISNSCFRAVETNLPNGMEGNGVELTDSGDDSGAKDPSRSRLNEFFATLQDKKESGPGDEVELMFYSHHRCETAVRLT